MERFVFAFLSVDSTHATLNTPGFKAHGTPVKHSPTNTDKQRCLCGVPWLSVLV